MITLARPLDEPPRQGDRRLRVEAAAKAHPAWTLAACFAAGIVLGWLVKRRPS